MRIFISYRREDSMGSAGRLYDHLAAHFGAENVFLDTDAVQPGQDFVDAIEIALLRCDAVLVVIGRQWLAINDAAGARRLDHPQDFVRLEISIALQRRLLVIPVLVEQAAMPPTEALPADIQVLARLNAHPVQHAHFRADVEQLCAALESAHQRRQATPDAVDLSGWWVDPGNTGSQVCFRQKSGRVVGFYTIQGVKAGMYVGQLDGHVFEFYWRWLDARHSGHGRAILSTDHKQLTGYLWEGTREDDQAHIRFEWGGAVLPDWIGEDDFAAFAPGVE